MFTLIFKTTLKGINFYDYQKLLILQKEKIPCLLYPNVKVNSLLWVYCRGHYLSVKQRTLSPHNILINECGKNYHTTTWTKGKMSFLSSTYYYYWGQLIQVLFLPFPPTERTSSNSKRTITKKIVLKIWRERESHRIIIPGI